MSKEEIINATVNPLLPSIEGIRTKTREAMSQYAEQEVEEFQKWTNLNGWFWAPNQWRNYHGDDTRLSTKELYQLYKKETQQTKSS